MDCTCLTENMGAGPRSGALRVAVLVFGVTLAAAIAMAQLGVAPGWRMILFPAFYVAVYTAGVALTGTCGVTALRGKRNIDGSEERIADPDVLRATRRVGNGIIAVVTATAAVLTLGLVAV